MGDFPAKSSWPLAYSVLLLLPGHLLRTGPEPRARFRGGGDKPDSHGLVDKAGLGIKLNELR